MNAVDEAYELGERSEGKSRSYVSAQQNDDEVLARQGKRPQLKRNFGFWSMLGLATTELVSWEAIFFVNPTALEEAGPVGLLYGFIFCFFGTLATAASMAELVSMAPVSGGQYHWVAMLAPPKHRVFLSWVTGWLSFIGWQAFVASGAFICATVTQGLVILNYPTYDAQRWQGTLIFYLVLVICVFTNTLAAKALPRIEGLILIIHVLGFFAILIPLTYLAPKHDAKFVFATFVNLSGWENRGAAWFIGLLSGVYPFLGYDGPCHMAEEVKDAATIVPWCMVTAILVNGLLALGIVIAFLYTLGGLESVLESPTGYDSIQIFYNITNSLSGTDAMVSVLIALACFATFGLLASTSRLTWAFARDRGLPFSRLLAKVHQPSALPLNAIALSTIISALLALINIGSTSAFNAIVSITVAGLSFSYFLPILLLAIRRVQKNSIKFGPWRMGKLGFAVNVFALMFLLLTTLFSFFPPQLPVSAENMNYSCLVFGGALLFGLVYYAFFGKHNYHGPQIEMDIRYFE